MAEGLIDVAQPESQNLSPEVIQQNIQMPPELQEAYERVVLAGMKALFSEGSNREMLRRLEGKGPIGLRLGKGISTLLLLLYSESNKTLPQAVIIPAGTYLIAQAADFLNQSGIEKLSNTDIGEALATFVEATIQGFGGNLQKMYGLLDQYQPPEVNH